MVYDRFWFYGSRCYSHAQKTLKIREQTIIGSVSYRNRYWVYCIESYRLLFYQGKPDVTCITAGSAAVNWLHYTGWSKQVCTQSTAARKCHLIVHDTGGGWRGERRKETITLYQLLSYTKMVQYWVLATSDRWCCTPSTRRQWWPHSPLSIILTFLQIDQS